jgi:hypothetical protein
MDCQLNFSNNIFKEEIFMSETSKTPISANKTPAKSSPKAKPKAPVKSTSVKVAAKPVAKAVVEPVATKSSAKVAKAKPVKPAATPSKPEATVSKPAVTASKKDKPKKVKLIRDSFTMPETDYAHIASVKARCLKAGVNAKKSEVLRAGLNVLAKLSDSALKKALADLAVIKTGRPVKS